MTRNPLLVGIGLLTVLIPTTCLFLSVNTYFFVPLVVGIGCVVVGSFNLPVRLNRVSTAFGLVLCLAATIGPFALAAYANRTAKPIRVVLPVGFHGEFSIVKNHTEGQELKLQDGEWIFEIPASGVLVVKDDYPFYLWHVTHFVYTDGNPVLVKSLGTTAGNIDINPNHSIASTDYDGTTHRWKVVEIPS